MSSVAREPQGPRKRGACACGRAGRRKALSPRHEPARATGGRAAEAGGTEGKSAQKIGNLRLTGPPLRHTIRTQEVLFMAAVDAVGICSAVPYGEGVSRPGQRRYASGYSSAEPSGFGGQDCSVEPWSTGASLLIIPILSTSSGRAVSGQERSLTVAQRSAGRTAGPSK